MRISIGQGCHGGGFQVERAVVRDQSKSWTVTERAFCICSDFLLWNWRWKKLSGKIMGNYKKAGAPTLKG